jgi:hypothetical protein
MWRPAAFLQSGCDHAADLARRTRGAAGSSIKVWIQAMPSVLGPVVRSAEETRRRPKVSLGTWASDKVPSGPLTPRESDETGGRDGLVRQALREVEEQFAVGRNAGDHACLRSYEEFCLEVGRVYDEAADRAGDPRVAAGYQALRVETAAQFAAIVSTGLTVRPWLGDGQPYKSSRDLRERVTSTGTLSVFLTCRGHGKLTGATPGHPMCQDSAEVIDGEPLLYNDLFRAVHDGIGHVLYDNDFSLVGELRASFAHMRMYSPRAVAALLTETVGQICWFYRGPHMLTAGGRPLQPGDPGYCPPRSRPYPDQKAFLFPEQLTARFRRQFEEVSA